MTPYIRHLYQTVYKIALQYQEMSTGFVILMAALKVYDSWCHWHACTLCLCVSACNYAVSLCLFESADLKLTSPDYKS